MVKASDNKRLVNSVSKFNLEHQREPYIFFLEGGGAKIRMVAIASLLEIIVILGHHAASISAAISHATQLLGYGKLRDRQSEMLLSESWAVWATKHMTFRSF